MQVRRVSGLVFAALLLAGSIAVAVATGATDQRRATFSAKALIDSGDELVGDRTVGARTYRTERGAFVTRVFASAVHRRDGAGRLGRVEEELQPEGSQLVLRGSRVTARLPERLSGGARVQVSAAGLAVTSQLVQAAPRTAKVEGAAAEYPDVRPGVDVRVTALSEGVKETITLDGPEATRRFVYDLAVPDGATAKLTARGGVAIAVPGDVDFEITPPFMYDADRRFAPESAARYGLQRTGDGYELTLALSQAWLVDKHRAFPVTVDPTIRRTGASETVDASLLESVPDLGYGGSEGIFVGEYDAYPGNDNRGVLKFDLTGAVPSDARVLQADLGLKSYYRENSTAKKVGVHALTHAFTHDTTWNDYDGTNAWPTAGGDFDPAVAATATVGTQLGWHHWYPTELAQAWVNGSTPNHGLLLQDLPGEPPNGSEFRSSEYGTAADRPYLDIVWYPRTGDSAPYVFDDHPLQDGTVLKTNVFNGNLFFERHDVDGTGPGQDFQMRRYFNSKAADADPIHSGFPQATWTSSNGKFVGGTVMDNGDFIHQGPSGYLVTFTKQPDGSFVSPPELDATLTEDTGSGWNDRYELTDVDGSTMTFAVDGTFTSHTDPDNNTYTPNYPAPSYLHTSITGTNSQNTTFTYAGSSGNERLTQTTNPASQYTTYTYTSDKLTSDARNGTTELTYDYDTNGRLNRITDSAGRVTQITIDSSNRVTQIIDGPNSTDPTTTFAYAAASSPCETGSVHKTTVTNPDSTVHIYCTDAGGSVVSSSTTAAEDPQVQSLAAQGYAEDQAVTLATAYERLKRQDKSVGLGESVAGSTSGGGYAGVWFDHVGGRVKVMLKTGTATTGATQAIADHGLTGDADIVMVAHTQAELEAGRDAIAAPIEDLVNADLVSADFNTEANRVDVQVATSLGATDLARVSSARAAVSVASAQTSVAPGMLTDVPAYCDPVTCDPPIRGGREIFTGSGPGQGNQCTAGFSAYSRTDGLPYVITAGHCLTNVTASYKASMPGDSDAEIGPRHPGWQIADPGENGDFGLIRIVSGSSYANIFGAYIYVSAYRYRKILIPRTPAYQIRNVKYNSRVIVCMSARGGKTVCGRVVRLGRKKDKLGHIKLFKCDPGSNGDRTRIVPGDSGAPVFKSGTALGVVLGYLTDDPCTVVFSGARLAEDSLHVNIRRVS